LPQQKEPGSTLSSAVDHLNGPGAPNDAVASLLQIKGLETRRQSHVGRNHITPAARRSHSTKAQTSLQTANRPKRNARCQRRANVQDKKRAKQDTGADGAREKTHFYFLSIVAPADGIKAAKLR
jgi:hypothetical protein